MPGTSWEPRTRLREAMGTGVMEQVAELPSLESPGLSLRTQPESEAEVRFFDEGRGLGMQQAVELARKTIGSTV